MNNDLKKELPLIAILLIPVIIAVAVYPYLPDVVPTHWNARGEVDGYGSKEFGALFIPLMNIGLYALLLFLPKLDPKKANYLKFTNSYLLIRYAFHIFLCILYIATILAALGKGVDITLWISISMALMFIVMGIAMSKIRYNYFVGFRLPWTLASEGVWNKTHQVGGKAMALGGVAALIGIFLANDSIRIYILLAGIFLPIIFVAVYSYFLYKKGV